MKKVLSLLAVFYFVLCTALHTQSQARDAPEPTGGYVKLPLQNKPVRSALNKRQSSVPVGTPELGAAYFVDGAQRE
jgi:hypothetical protein